MTALLLLAAAGSAGLGTPWPLLAIGFVGGVGLLRERSHRERHLGWYGSVHEQKVATIYQRAGSLRLRRRKEQGS